MRFTRIGRRRNMEPEVCRELPRDNLAVELLNRLTHSEFLPETLTGRIDRIAIAEIGVFDSAFHPLNNVLRLVNTGEYGFCGRIYCHPAPKQHQRLLPGLNRSGNAAGPRKNRPTSAGGILSAKCSSFVASSRHLTAVSTSIRAIIAPRQKCLPMPNAA